MPKVTTQPKKVRKPRKVNKESIDMMSEKHSPTTGYKYTKSVKKVKDEYVFSYVIKGDSDILDFVKNRFYDGISAISQDVIFEYIDLNNGNGNQKTVIIVDDTNKYPNIKNGFYKYIAQPPIIDINKALDNALEIRISISKEFSDIYDTHFLFVVEYLLKALGENIELVEQMISKNKELVSSDLFIDDILSDKDQSLFFGDSIYITNKDKERILQAQEEETLNVEA